MILNLKVKDFALIEDIEINFSDGLTVLTGETGAGKSIILESLHLLFAKRSDQEMIRHGKNKAIVSGLFSVSPLIQKEFELPNIIEVTREIDLSGRHKISLNNNIITLNLLKKIMDNIGLIHSQNDTFLLLDSSEYLNFIDLVNVNIISKQLNKYLILRNDYLSEKNHLNKLINKKAEDISKKEFLDYQLKELQSFKLKENEKEEIELEVDKLKHFDKIAHNLKETTFFLNENIDIDSIYQSAKLLEKIENFDNDFIISKEKLFNFYYEFIEVKEILNMKIDNLDFDEQKFDLMQERVYELSKLEDKYNKSIKELLQYQNEIDETISLIENYDEYIEKYTKKVNDKYNLAYGEALKLSEIRKKLAKELELELINELADLDLDKANFKIDFKTYQKEDLVLLENGIDEVEFLISLNEGEPLRVLSKVASGGERARFMFALKTIYAKQNNLSMLVLDEIDIGISGKTAAKVANKMVVLSKKLQLIVITHLPQVASKANTHYGIKKELMNERMVTSISKLTYDERVLMIALMLSDESLSNFAIEQAKMLLQK